MTQNIVKKYKVARQVAHTSLPCEHSKLQHVPSTNLYLPQSGNWGHFSKKQPTAFPARHLHFSHVSLPNGVKYWPGDTGLCKLLQHMLSKITRHLTNINY